MNSSLNHIWYTIVTRHSISAQVFSTAIWDREREICHPLVHFPNACNSQEPRTPLKSPVGGRDPSLQPLRMQVNRKMEVR